MSKKKENPQTNLQFPKIYRFITEKIKNSKGDLRIMIAGFILGALLVLIVIFGVYLAMSLKEKASIESQKRVITSQIEYWERVTEKQEGYRDGYFMLAVLQYQLKDFNKSQEYLDRVTRIDPNFLPAEDLQKALSKGD